jgi:hypothetical protein
VNVNVHRTTSVLALIIVHRVYLFFVIGVAVDIAVVGVAETTTKPKGV